MNDSKIKYITKIRVFAHILIMQKNIMRIEFMILKLTREINREVR